MKNLLFSLFIAAATATASADDKKIVFLAGPPSHGPGEHEHRAGCLLLKSCLDHVPSVTAQVFSNGWPQDAAAAIPCSRETTWTPSARW